MFPAGHSPLTKANGRIFMRANPYKNTDSTSESKIVFGFRVKVTQTKKVLFVAANFKIGFTGVNAWTRLSAVTGVLSGEKRKRCHSRPPSSNFFRNGGTGGPHGEQRVPWGVNRKLTSLHTHFCSRNTWSVSQVIWEGYFSTEGQILRPWKTPNARPQHIEYATFKIRECLLTRLPNLKCISLDSVRPSDLLLKIGWLRAFASLY